MKRNSPLVFSKLKTVSFLKRKVNLPIEVFLYFLMATMLGFFIHVVLFLIMDLQPLLAASIAVVVSSCGFFGIMLLNNRLAETDDSKLDSLLAVKKLDAINITNLLAAYLVKTLNYQGIPDYSGSVSREFLINVDVNAIFVPIFYEEGKTIAKNFIEDDGNFMHLLLALTKSQREQLYRFFLVNA